MRNYLNGRGLTIAGSALLFCMTFSAPPAQGSTLITLSNWNQQQFNTDGDAVTVNIDNAANTLTVSWISGNSGLPNGIGIDKFFFNGQNLLDSGNLATSAGWGLKNGSSHNADGFTASYVNEMDNPGGGQLNNIVFAFGADGGTNAFDTDFSASSSFAAHVRYDSASGGTCSGFASDQIHPLDTMANDPGCQPQTPETPTQTPESSSLILLGLALPVIGFVTRWIPGAVRK